MDDSAPQCCGIVGSDFFQSSCALFLFRRCVDVCDEFFELCRSEISSDPEKIATMLHRSVPRWGWETLKQRTERFNVFCDRAQFDNAFQQSCVRLVRLTYGKSVKGEQLKLKIRIPKKEEFVQQLFTRLAHTRELRNGGYFAQDTRFRNFAVSGAMMDALDDVMKSNFKVGERCEATPGPMTLQQPMYTVQHGDDGVTRLDTAHAFKQFNQFNRYPSQEAAAEKPNAEQRDHESQDKKSVDESEQVLQSLQQDDRPPSKS